MGDGLIHHVLTVLLAQVGGPRTEQLGETGAIDENKGLDFSGNQLYPTQRAT